MDAQAPARLSGDGLAREDQSHRRTIVQISAEMEEL